MSPEGQSAQILVVDDDAALRRGLTEHLISRGYRVVTASDGPSALALLATTVCDLVFCDIMMPGMSGIQVVTRISEIYPHLPVVMLTALSDAEVTREALRQGAADFVAKPFSYRDIPIVVERNLERQRLNHARLEEQQGAALLAIIDVLAAAMGARERVTAEHSGRMVDLTLCIADGLDLTLHERFLLRLAAPMHDVGKIGISDRILLKTVGLDPEEWKEMKRHPEIGAQILRQIPELREVATIIRHHHERIDGHGYPDGLAGDAIPLPSRIIAIADAFDAMTSDRPYRKGMPVERALAELTRHAGSQFDSLLLEIFTSRYDQGSGRSGETTRGRDRRSEELLVSDSP